MEKWISLFYTDLFQFDCETSQIGWCKFCWDSFLQPTSTEQWGLCFLLKKTTSQIFVGDRIHDWRASSNFKSDALKPLGHVPL